MPRYECNIAVEVDADTPEEAAAAAAPQFRDPAVEYWTIGVKDLDACDGYEHIVDERDVTPDGL